MINSWEEFWRTVGSEEWLTAKALLELSPAVQRDAARCLDDTDDERGPWQAWVDDVETSGRGWSSTEARLYAVVASLTTGRPLDLSTLAYMGSWEIEVWAALVDWGTGGNNREHGGRARVIRS